MKRNMRTMLMTVIATTAVLALLPLGPAAGAQAPVPPPPAAPFDSSTCPWVTGAVLRPDDPVGDSYLAAGSPDRDAVHRWWLGLGPLNAPPTYANILGPIAMGLERASARQRCGSPRGR